VTDVVSMRPCKYYQVILALPTWQGNFRSTLQVGPTVESK
jgi:hypothetical protein